jgi:hypothetical protein
MGRFLTAPSILLLKDYFALKVSQQVSFAVVAEPLPT